jgi:hypothetical protein
MSLIHPFRRIPQQGRPPVPTVPAVRASTSPPAYPASPQEQQSAAPVLTCRWEVADEQEVQLGGQTFHTGDMFLHWMPVH